MFNKATVLILAAVLCACSGGGGGDTAVVNTPPQSGVLDAAFGSAGIATGDPDGIGDINVDATGNSYISGWLAGIGSLEKLRADGTRDPAFGNGGVIRPGASALARDAAGNLYAALGRPAFDTTLTKLDPLGRPVPTFGNAGVAVIGPSTGGLAVKPESVLIDAGGNVYMVGEALDPTVGLVLVIIQFDANGLLARSFGALGSRILPLEAAVASSASAIDSAGALTVVVRTQQPSRLFVLKLDAAGNPVAGFGTSGLVQGPPCVSGGSLDVAVDAVDNLYITGCDDGSRRARLLKLDRQGAPVAAFGQGGVNNDVFRAAETSASAVALDARGQIYVVGGQDVPASGLTGFPCGNVMLAKLDATTGAPIQGFGTDGRTSFDLGGNDIAYKMALDGIGRIYIAANTRACGDTRPGTAASKFLVLRVLP